MWEAAKQLRSRLEAPTEAELDRERRERYKAERANPTGELAWKFAFHRKMEEERKAEEAALRGTDDEGDVETTSSTPEFSLETVTMFDHHSLSLNGIDPDANDIDFVSRPLNKLAAATDSGLLLYSGTANGPVRLHLWAATSEPDIDAYEWESLVDVLMQTPVGRIEFSSLLGDPVPEVNMATSGPGSYRVRIGNRGYNLAYDETVDEPVEDILVQVWPVHSSTAGAE